MLSRRTIVGCALCAASAMFAGGAASAQAPAGAPTLRRKILQSTDGPAPGYITHIVEIEIDPGALVARHVHPGIESSYMMEGGGNLQIDGQPDRVMGVGHSFQVPAGVPHAFVNGPAKSRLIGNFIVEKDKPLASPA